ncbi:MAG: hypothetical protein LBU48_00460 [Coriobacteriales bacterium]|jgi:hypothetical protein|nr:hypothetical protein [Coriobacteriales bacterium]
MILRTTAQHSHYHDERATQKDNVGATHKLSFLEVFEQYPIAELDAEQGLLRHDDNAAAYCKALRSFVRTTVPLLNAMDDPQKETLGRYAIQAREVKNSCRIICATPLSILAEELEVAARSLDVDFVWDYNGYFHFRARYLIEDIEELLNRLQ